MGRAQQSLAIINWRRQTGIVLANSSLKFRWCSCGRPLLEDSTGGFVEAYDAMLLIYEDALECPSTDIFVSLRGWRPNHPLRAYSVVQLDDEKAVYLRFHACGEPPVQGHVGLAKELELARLDGNHKPVVATVQAPRCGWKNFRLTDGQHAVAEPSEAFHAGALRDLKRSTTGVGSLANNKRKGAAFEQAVADYLAASTGQDVERRHLAGANDRGDIAGFKINGQRVVVECKNTSKLELAAHLAEAEVERQNDNAAVGILVQKRRGVGMDSDEKVGQHFVVMTLDTFSEILKITSKEGK